MEQILPAVPFNTGHRGDYSPGEAVTGSEVELAYLGVEEAGSGDCSRL